MFDQVLDGIPGKMASSKEKVGPLRWQGPCALWDPGSASARPGRPPAHTGCQATVGGRVQQPVLSCAARTQVFQSYVESLDEDPKQYRQDTQQLEGWAKELGSPDQLMPSADGSELQKALAAISQRAKDGEAGSGARPGGPAWIPASPCLPFVSWTPSSMHRPTAAAVPSARLG